MTKKKQLSCCNTTRHNHLFSLWLLCVSVKSLYLKSKDLWREDPSPGRIVHQGQYAVHTRESVEGSKQVNPVPVITTVFTHRPHLLQVLSLHISMSACISRRNTKPWHCSLFPFFMKLQYIWLNFKSPYWSLKYHFRQRAIKQCVQSKWWSRALSSTQFSITYLELRLSPAAGQQCSGIFSAWLCWAGTLLGLLVGLESVSWRSCSGVWFLLAFAVLHSVPPLSLLSTTESPEKNKKCIISNKWWHYTVHMNALQRIHGKKKKCQYWVISGKEN